MNEGVVSSDTKECPFCAETIKAAAKVCRFCNRSVEEQAPVLARPVAVPSPSPVREETTIFQATNVMVTNRRVVIDGTTYALVNITSVSSTATPTNAGVHEMFGCAVYAIIVIVVFVAVLATAGFSSWNWLIALLGPIIPAVIAARAYHAQNPTQYLYYVRLRDSGAETNVLSSKDKQFVNSVVKAVNDAIATR